MHSNRAMAGATTLKMLVTRQQQQGSHRGSGSNSASSIVSTLVPVFVVACILFAAFLFLRTKFQRVYEPRSLKDITPQHQRAKRAQGTTFGWVTAMKEVKDSDLLRQHSLDAFLYLRFFKMLIVISFVGVCITWPILFPVNATGGGTESQLDILSFSNVANPNRYYAHALVAWVFQGFVVYLITRERKFFIGLRQAYFLSPLHALRLSSRTVLFLSIPKDDLSEGRLRQIFPRARKIWMAPDCEDLQDMVDDRDKEWARIEKTQVKLLQEVAKRASKGKFNERNPLEGVKTPTHRTKFLIGKEVDTIPYSRAEVLRLSKDIKKSQSALLNEDGEMLSAAFIEFENQLEAQKAVQFSVREKYDTWNLRHIGVQPEEVIWKNIGVGYKSRKLKMLGASLVVALLCLFWTVPVAFVGVLTNINYLVMEVPFLGFIDNIPPVILGVVTGLLPTILLAVLMILVPIFCRFLAKLAGAATLTEVELKTQSWYFAFQVIQVFLITTFSSGAASVAAQIVQQPTLAVTLLAQNLPKASNFYISYFILFGLNASAKQIINMVPFLLFVVLGFLDKTPRQKFNRWTMLKGLPWGSYYPKVTTLGVIALSYSCIAPLVLGFATVGFTLLYLGFRYNFLFVYGLQVDMKGEAYSKALQQLLTGVYLSTLCLIGLFAIRTSGDAAAAGPLALMIIFLVGLIIWQVLTDMAFSPYERHIPIETLESNEHSTVIASQVEDVEKEAASDANSNSITNAPQQSASPNTDLEKPDSWTGSQPQTYTRNAPATIGTTTSSPHPQPKHMTMLTRRVAPQINASFTKNKALIDSWSEDHKPEQYTAEDLDNAYQNPALSTETEPLIWIPRDQQGISKRFIQENREAGLESTDEHARLEGKGKGKVVFDTDQLDECPIWEDKKLW